MKKLFTIIALACFVQVSFGQSTLPNGGFESWTQHPVHGYWEPDGGFFKTLNILDTIPTPPGITAYPCDTAFTGNKSARLFTRKIDLMNILIPGVIGTVTINWATLGAILGTPYTWPIKAERFQGHYKAYPLNGDSTGAVILLSKWNPTTMKRDTIAYNTLIFHGVVDDWTMFDVLIDYWNTSTMPDSITLLLLSSGGYNATMMTASVGQVGSQALFDDVTLTNITGLEYILMPEVDVKLAPNPASSKMVVTLDKRIKNGLFEVYNAQGKLLQTSILNGKTTTLDVSRLINGVYYYKVTDGSAGLNSGQFIISK